MAKNIKYGAVIRRILQLLFFVAAPALFISVLSSIKAVVSAAANGQFSIGGLLPQITIIAAVIPMTILTGRFFCGYMCAFGSMQDFFGFLSKKIFNNRFKIGYKADKLLKYVKYAILLFLMLFVWILGSVSIDANVNPWNIFGIYATIAGWSDLSGLFTIGFALLVLILAGSMLIERFFCRYFCPLGAVFSIVSKFRLFRMKKQSNDCRSCQICSSHCPMGIPLTDAEIVRSGECIDCFQCVGSCPRGNIKGSVASVQVAPLAAGVIATAAIAGLYYAGSIVSQKSVSSEPLSTSGGGATLQQGAYTDGIYTGSAEGYRGTTTVRVSVQNGFITDIQLISTDDDEQFVNLCKNAVISEIIETQSSNVSAVTGATFSSNAIMDAVADALGIAMTAVEQPSESPDAETAPESSGSNAQSAGVYKDGVYTGSGTGFRGKTTVSVTVSGGQIAQIDIISYEDDTEYFERASRIVVDEIISAQAVDVDAVSGATFSSNGIMEAVADALGAEFDNPNDTLQNSGHGGHFHSGFKQ